ncbi:MAG TPA: tripartite tricarboxylate transporter substrate binding protein [Xanthobacteraceae bacterium]|nr:tripartite tricarboxylate transporter substrate binding protein [Xanthobacteraceae bacterium]
MRMVLALATALCALAAPAAAQAWPERALRLVVPYPPGGNVDSAARIVAVKLQEKLGQPIVIENKAGAGGLIGAEFVAKAAPDGYTLLVGANGPILFAPEITGKRAYEWSRDFAPISTISMTPLVLQVHPSVPARTLQEFFDLAKREGGKLNMASPGPGTTNHLLSELLQSVAGVTWTTVHYRGNAPATNDLIAGHVQFNFDQISVALPFVQDGKTRALAVTGTKRAHWLPDVPTFAELGYSQVVGQTFTALLAPAGTPAPVIARLSAAMGDILRDKDVIEKFDVLGAEAVAMTPDALRQYLASEDATWMPVVRKANIKAE